MKRHLLDTIPMPLARAYRQMYDQGAPAEAYHFIALFIEPLLKWYGALSFAMLRTAMPQQIATLNIPRQLTLSLGHWLSSLQTLASQPPSNYAPGWEPLRTAIDELRRKATPEMKACIEATEHYAAAELAKRTALDFLAASVFYRNRTRGHGAPTVQHQQEFAPLLLAAYESLLATLDSLGRLKLIYIERAEIVGVNCVHSLRECQGLFSSLLPERLTTAKSQALSSQALYLFSANLEPLLELSPLLIRPTGRDALYFLNSCAGGAEYLSYDGSAEEFHRPESYAEALREFFGAVEVTPRTANTSASTVAPPAADSEDLGFGNLGLW